MNRRAYLKSSLALGCGLLLPAGVATLVGRTYLDRTDASASFSGSIMGTSYSVLFGDISRPGLNDNDELASELARHTESLLQSIDATMSTWRSDSELSLFNQSSSTDWQSFQPATIDVISHAQQTSAITRGAFDISIGPMVDLWGFGSGASHHGKQAQLRMPPSIEIQSALDRVGYRALEVDSAKHLVRKLNPNLYLDLSGIAKGYAVDKVAEYLLSEGVDNFLVEVGGELRSHGRKTNDSNWRVAIERPRASQQDAFRIIGLENQGVATSGDYRNFFIENGQRFSHSIDPRTGEPIKHALASVTVVAASTMEADALSTALMVMGPSDALAFAEHHNIAAQLITKDGNALKEMHSNAFSPLIV